MMADRRKEGKMEGRWSVAVMILIGVLVCPIAAAAQTIAITGGTVYPIAGPPIDNGTVLIRDGQIAGVGASIGVPAGAQRIDASGKWVTPGLINAATQIGLVEIGAVQGTVDRTMSESDISASFNVLEGVNPASQLIPVTRIAGITTVLAGPSGGIISGQAVLIDLFGDQIEDMLILSPAGMVVHINEEATQSAGGSRAGVMGLLRQLFNDAREYESRRAEYERGEMRELAAPQADLEALLPVLNGNIPLMVTANRRSDIENALRMAEHFGITLIVTEAAEGWQIADRLAASRTPVIVDPLANIPRYDGPSARLENPSLLSQAGANVIIASFDSHNSRNLRQSAGNAVAYGMDWDAALQSVTLGAAEVLRISDRYGSLETGKVANVVVWTGDPFEFSTDVEHVFIRGQQVPITSRQRELLRKYREVPPR